MTSQNQSTSELLAKLATLEKVYDAAKKELNDVRKKLHGTPFTSRSRSGHPVSSTPVSSSPAPKRGRGRPRKNVCTIENGDNDNDKDNYHINDDKVSSSCDTVDRQEDEQMTTDYYNNNIHEFKGAVFTFISDGIYIETCEGKFYDIYTLELRGWFNPYIQRSEWL